MFFLLALIPALLYGQGTNATRRLDHAASVLQEIMQVSDRAIPQTLLDKSQCVVIVPGLKKGAFFFGAKYGRGFASCRRKGEAGWGPPASIRMEGGSLGIQIGGSETDVIMLVMNQRGFDRLMRSKFTLGANAAVAAGPVGRDANADTDALLTAEILTWSRSRGIFAGVSLQGATLRSDKDVNQELYGQPWLTKDVVSSGLDIPASGEPLVRLLNKYSGRQSR